MKTGEDAVLITTTTSAPSVSPWSIPALRAPGKPLFTLFHGFAQCQHRQVVVLLSCPWHSQALPAPACLRRQFLWERRWIISLLGSSLLRFQLGTREDVALHYAPMKKSQTRPLGKLFKEKEFLIRFLIKNTEIQFSHVWPPARREALPSRGLKQQLPTIQP